MPPSDGSDANATIEKNRRSLVTRFKRPSGAPIARAPIAREQFVPGHLGEQLSDAPLAVPSSRRSLAFPEAENVIAAPVARRALTVVDGDDSADSPEEAAKRTSINPSTASTLGDFAAAMAGPIAAAAFARSVAVFIGAALLVLLVRAQGRRSALTESEVAAVSPFVAAFGASVMTYAAAAGDGFAHALSAGLIALVTGATAVLLLRLVVERFVHTRIAVIGDAAVAHRLAWQLSSAGDRRHSIVGYVTRTTERDNLRDLDRVSFKIRRLGLVSELSHIVARSDIDLLVMASESDRLKVFERAAVCSERFHTRLLSLTAFEESVFRRVPLEDLNVAWFQHVMHPRFRPVPRAVTRAIDIVFAAVVGLVTLPAWAPAAAFMRLAFGRPVLVERRRIGERGRTLSLLRFRVARRSVTGGPPEEDAPAVGFGKFLRKTGIERLPSLINLARGDITLVGPRAVRPDRLAELEREIPFYGRRNMMRPGVTGWAQLRDSSDPAVELSNDLFYLKHQSLMLYGYVLLASLWRPLRRATTSN